jgi:PAS domain S-box-containing protein
MEQADKAEALSHIQHNLGIALISTMRLDQALRLCLEAAISASSMDCGGIYLVDEVSGSIDLAFHVGLPSNFIERAAHYDADTDHARLIKAGVPVYTSYQNDRYPQDDPRRREGLRGVAVIPVAHEGHIVSCLNIASHSHEEVPLHSRVALEAISTQIGSVIARSKAEDLLRESQANLQILFDSLDDFIFVIDMNGRIVRVNPAVLRRLGYSENELVGQSVTMVHPADRREEMITIIRDILDGKAESCPIPLMAKNGTCITVDTKVTKGRWSGQDVLFGIGRDITEYRKVEGALYYRMEFEALVTAISTNFINLTCDEIDDGINRALQRVGEFADVDRSYVFRLCDDGMTLVNTHEWCAPGIEPQIDNLKGIPIEVVPWWMQRLRRFEDIHIPVVADLPPEAGAEKEILQSQSILSLVVIPMVCAGNLIGFVGLDSVRREKVWSQDIIALLRVVGEVFVNALQRRLADDELMTYRLHLENLVEDRTARLARSNEALRHEISERRQAEDALRASEERYRTIINSMSECIHVVDNELKLILFNDAFVKWNRKLGLRTDVIGLTLTEVFPFLPDTVCEEYRQVFDSGDVLITEETNRVGERSFVTDTRKVPVFDRGRVVRVVTIIRDVTESKKVAEELLRIQKLESVGVLAGGIAHDFNNILTAILGNIFMARTESNSDRVSGWLAEAETAVHRARNLTQQLLTFSRGGAPVKRAIDLARLLKDTATLSLSGSSAKCVLSVPAELWSVQADEGQIGQVISNVIINADQAMPGGGIVKVCAENVAVNAAQQLLPLKAGDYVKISFEDQGVGIPREVIQRIFDPFFTTKPGGTGLGLAISYSIINNHDGYIATESEVGKGSTFRIYLPAVSAEPELEEDKSEDLGLLQGRGRILLMDDDEAIRNLVARGLSKWGYEVVVADNGAKAIELYRDASQSGHAFDAVILDLTVQGGMGGREAIQELIHVDPCVKAVVTSGYAADPIMANFTECGFSGVLAKPYTLKELSEVLHRVIAGAR